MKSIIIIMLWPIVWLKYISNSMTMIMLINTHFKVVNVIEENGFVLPY